MSDSIWKDPATGIIYHAETMAPVTTAGDNLGELSARKNTLPVPTDSDVDAFADLLGIDADE